MNWLARLYRNHVLANLTFLLVLVAGLAAWWQMPREQDPSINFNWIDITTIVPGMAAADIETRVTDVLEDAVRQVSDIKFVSSNSRDGVSHILVRFADDMAPRLFDKRVNDLRRELQNKEAELPDQAETPFVFEVTSANAYPTATVLVVSQADDENLHRQAVRIKKDLERLPGTDRILDTALHDRELQVDFDPTALEAAGLSPTQLADSVAAHYRDLAAGEARVGDQSWLVRLQGTSADPAHLAALPVVGARAEVPLDAVAEVHAGHVKARHLVRSNGRPAVMLAITKKPSANTLKLLARLKAYIAAQNRLTAGTGVRLVLANDSTETTRTALRVMQNNALLGLGLVLLVTWAFLGLRIALLTSIGIPFILFGTFWLLQAQGQTLNVSVLLGVVIALGMLVDDAVVVVEGIYDRLQRGVPALQAALGSLREVAAPVTAAVLTTMAAFLPLMLLPGILGQYMRVIPLVVTTALAISLVEAFWMLPAHVIAARVHFDRPGRVQRWRARALHRIRIGYTRLLIRALHRPRLLLGGLTLLFVLAVFAAVAGQVRPEWQHHPLLRHLLVRTDFFASDPLRMFYVNIEMPTGTPLEDTLDTVLAIERRVRAHLRPGEVRSIVSYAGQMFTETAPFQGARYGQILVTLQPAGPGRRDVPAMLDDMRADVFAVPGPVKRYFLRLSGGPPTSKPISVKVRGDDLTRIKAAADTLVALLRQTDWARDISTDDSPGKPEMTLRLDADAARRAGIDPLTVARTLRLLVDGEVVARLRHQGEALDVRVRARPAVLQDIHALLTHTLPAPDGRRVPLSALLHATTDIGVGNIRHYNFRRAITVEADIDKDRIDTLAANRYLQDHWARVRDRFPGIDLDFSGELDDIYESLAHLGTLLLLGVLLMYAILGAQFRSYFQPLIILTTVPMAFTGVVIGLLVTGNPLSLFTLYGVVALAGIAVNAAIVLISAANDRLARGMTVLHATLYAARRRVVPILITSLTTIAGLFSLATGLGGHSLLWGPVATAIVWGLAVSTGLTLFVIPLLYRLTMTRSHLSR